MGKSTISVIIANKKIKFFKGENVEKFLKESNLKLLGELPMTSAICN